MLRKHFSNMWKKNNKMKCKMMAKVEQRGWEPTYDNCRDYYIGLIKPFKNPRSGMTEHLHLQKDRRQIWRLNYGRTESVPRQNKHKKRRVR